MNNRCQIIQGDCLSILPTLPADSVHCVVTSPPYWGLRDYGIGEAGIGLEQSPEEWCARLVEVFREVRRVLHQSGTVWVNCGDAYARQGGDNSKRDPSALMGGQAKCVANGSYGPGTSMPDGLKPKDLIGLPWMLAFALRSDGWYLRSDVIWAKPNPMPESVTDRPTNAHEHIFLLSKRPTYFYDAEAIRENVAPSQVGRERADRIGGNGHADRHGLGFIYDTRSREDCPTFGKWSEEEPQSSGRRLVEGVKAARANGGEHDSPFGPGRNRRNVWTIATEPFSGASLLADYVGPDGTPYTASPDCPTHGHLANLRSQQTVERDERSDPRLLHNRGNGDRPVPVPSDEHVSIVLMPNDTTPGEAATTRIPESTPGSRRQGQILPSSEHSPVAAVETLDRTNHTVEFHERPADSSDSSHLVRSPSAIPSSTESHRMDRAPATMPPYTASSGTGDGTGRTPATPSTADSAGRTHESNTEQVEMDGLLSGQTVARSAGKSSRSSYRKCTAAKCTCQPVKVDHFATFPTDLVKPCVLAGTSERGVCPECGKPWRRVVEKSGGTIGKSWHDHSVDIEEGQRLPGNSGGIGNKEAKAGNGYRVQTTGWTPGCSHGLDPIPATVCDPFSGSGTTGLVALLYGRSYIGIELNPDYVAMSERRLHAAKSQEVLDLT